MGSADSRWRWIGDTAQVLGVVKDFAGASGGLTLETLEEPLQKRTQSHENPCLWILDTQTKTGNVAGSWINHFDD